eukprot:scpid57786/ scgid7239/ 
MESLQRGLEIVSMLTECMSLRNHVLDLQRFRQVSNQAVNPSEQHAITLDASLVSVSVVKEDDGSLTCSSEDHTIIRDFLRTSVCSGNVETVEALFRTIDTAASAEQPDGRSVSFAIESSEGYGNGPTTSPCRLRMIVDVPSQLSPKATRRPTDTEMVSCATKAERESCMSARSDDCALVNKQQNRCTTLSTTNLINNVYECHNCAFTTVKATLVHYAILAECMEMITCLVNWGADVSTTLMSRVPSKRSFPMEFLVELSSLSLAVHLGLPRMVEQLLSLGESPHHTSLQVSEELQLPCSLCNNGDMDSESACVCRFYGLSCRDNAEKDRDMCLALWSCPCYPPPASSVYSITDRYSNWKLLLPYYRWDTECAELETSVWIHSILPQEFSLCRLKEFLATPCYTEDEIVCKKFFCALLLQRLMIFDISLRWFRSKKEREHTKEEIASMILSLMQHGAEPSGLSALEAENLCNDWLQVKQSELQFRNMTRQPFNFVPQAEGSRGAGHEFPMLANCVDRAGIRQHLPQASSRVLLNITTPDAQAYLSCAPPPAVCRMLLLPGIGPFDKVVKLMVKAGGIPGIQSASDIPHVDGFFPQRTVMPV